MLGTAAPLALALAASDDGRLALALATAAAAAADAWVGPAGPVVHSTLQDGPDGFAMPAGTAVALPVVAPGPAAPLGLLGLLEPPPAVLLATPVPEPLLVFVAVPVVAPLGLLDEPPLGLGLPPVVGGLLPVPVVPVVDVMGFELPLPVLVGALPVVTFAIPVAGWLVANIYDSTSVRHDTPEFGPGELGPAVSPDVPPDVDALLVPSAACTVADATLPFGGAPTPVTPSPDTSIAGAGTASLNLM
jgi:hypothetical protein